MKTWLIALPFLFATHVTPAADQAESASAQAAPPAEQKMTARERARLHQRDMRHCLDKKTNKEIHHCAVKKHRR